MLRGLSDNLRLCQTLPYSLRRCQEVSQRVSDGASPSQKSTTEPRGLPDSLRRSQTLPDRRRRYQKVSRTVFDGARHSHSVDSGAKRSPRQSPTVPEIPRQSTKVQ
ncbi:hypothetical protein DPMN_191561 [Dreissena polymorpha]|uniref:Uncharacterized protein n=1 Tax=Dreissena polymorpha TaxID=45954 RepID=A0A9D4B7K7_DREPO|nr:hypothetical protein DPMN_191561 [Dreissena polymorpha]